MWVKFPTYSQVHSREVDVLNFQPDGVMRMVSTHVQKQVLGYLSAFHFMLFSHQSLDSFFVFHLKCLFPPPPPPQKKQTNKQTNKQKTKTKQKTTILVPSYIINKYIGIFDSATALIGLPRSYYH